MIKQIFEIIMEDWILFAIGLTIGIVFCIIDSIRVHKNCRKLFDDIKKLRQENHKAPY